MLAGFEHVPAEDGLDTHYTTELIPLSACLEYVVDLLECEELDGVHGPVHVVPGQGQKLLDSFYHV